MRDARSGLAKPEENIFTGKASFPLSHRLERALFRAVWFLFARWTPPAFYKWRAFLLNLFGANIHPSARLYSSVQVWYPKNLHVGANSIIGPNAICYSMDKIEVGDFVIVSQGAYLCTGSHDISDVDFSLKTAPIAIGDRAWIAAQSFVGPGVAIGDEAVLGARGVTFRDLDAGGVYVGNPAKWIKNRNLA
ncbi:putative colanic acid biosynthesis acetyltransferase [Maritalea sp.]|uniref:putative colanic acid biosynthesis acetyltransferase n=1 Tax=Maritalea sp. TaxID=2003361 RepID=UPI003EF0A6FB